MNHCQKKSAAPALLLALALALTAGGCGGAAPPPSSPASPPPASQGAPEVSSAPSRPPEPLPQEERTEPPEGASEPFPGAIPLGNDYIASIADGLLRQIITPEMDQYQQVKTVYRWLVENTAFFNDPVGLDVWQWRGDVTQVPTYVENRAISPILFGIGSCEDYASAAVVLLRRLGIPAEYAAGLTISVQGTFVDHAWAVVELGGVWYHIDPQLEDNITRGNRLNYRFFLKSDEVMRADHRWGENLIAYYGGGMTPERTQNIRENWMVPQCPSSLPAPEPELLDQPPTPNRSQTEARLAEERQRWEREHGPLPQVESNTTPPVL